MPNDEHDALENIKRALQHAITRDNKPILFVLTGPTRKDTLTTRHQVFTMDARKVSRGQPHWLMWSVSVLAGYRLDRKTAGRDYVTGSLVDPHDIVADIMRSVGLTLTDCHVEVLS